MNHTVHELFMSGSFTSIDRWVPAANLVVTDGVTDGNTVLSSEEVEMLSVLRINRRFMELCRSKFAKEAK